MKVHRITLAALLAVPLLAQPQIGGGTCSSATLSGNYSATLTGRDLSSAVTFTTTTEGVGSVTFDGLSKVTFTLTTNTNKTFGTAQTLAGTYSLQANCVGVVTITSGDAASFTLEAYNQGKSYLLTGQDGVYGLSGSGSLLPATCPASITTGSYPFNGTGLALTGSTISGIFNILGIVQFSGPSTIAINAFVAANGTSSNVSSTGTYTLGTSGTQTISQNCTATATLTDALGNTYKLAFEFTSASGNNFIFSSASANGLYTASGRSL